MIRTGILVCCLLLRSGYRYVACFFGQALGALFQTVIAPLPQARPGGEPCTSYYRCTAVLFTSTKVNEAKAASYLQQAVCVRRRNNTQKKITKSRRTTKSTAAR